jgi:hypothetical protein
LEVCNKIALQNAQFLYLSYNLMVRNNKQVVQRLGLDNSLSICGKNAQLLARFYNTINAATRK